MIMHRKSNLIVPGVVIVGVFVPPRALGTYWRCAALLIILPCKMEHPGIVYTLYDIIERISYSMFFQL